MCAKIIGFVVWCFAFTVGLAAKDLPSYFPRCSRSDPEINKCMVEAANFVKPFLIRGVPELNIKPITPYYISEVSFDQGTPAINFKATLSNVSLFGLDTYEVTQFDYDVSNQKFYAQLKLGNLALVGKYKIIGKILAIPLQGEGTFVANVTHSNGTLFQTMRLTERRGQKYLEAVSTNITIDAGDVSSYLEGLFGGDQSLGKATNQALNENSKEIFAELKPVVEKIVQELTLNLQKKITQHVPYDLLYPPGPVNS